MTPKKFKTETKMRLIKPVVTSIIFAVDNMSVPMVYCHGIRWDGEKNNRFVVTLGKDYTISYMFKDGGEFGQTNNAGDVFENTYDSWEEAREAFEKFYK